MCVCVVFYKLCPRSWPWTAIKIFSHLYENRRTVDYILEVAPGCHCQVSENWLSALTVSKGSRNHTVVARIIITPCVKIGQRGLISGAYLLGERQLGAPKTRLNHPSQLIYTHTHTQVHKYMRYMHICVYSMYICIYSMYMCVCVFI